MDALDNRLTWTSAAGAELGQDTAATNGTVYYAEVPVKWARSFAASIKFDGVEVSAFTLESSNDPTLTPYSAASAGWVSQAAALGTKNAAGTASVVEWQVSDAESRRWRIKRDVTTGGVATARSHTKGGQ